MYCARTAQVCQEKKKTAFLNCSFIINELHYSSELC
jgi:hypothetical protein